MSESAIRVAGILRALSHPTRVQIVQLLASREMCVCEMQPALRIGQPTLSKHLATMRSQGILTCRREGTKVIYGLGTSKAARLVDLARSVLEDQLEDATLLWHRLKEA